MLSHCPYNRPMEAGDVTIYDSTLRDGEQMPGVAFSHDDKLEIATLLDDAGVPEIEAGFAAVSRGEMEAIRDISRLGLDARILSLARSRPQDIDCALDAEVDTVLIFAGTSEIHRRYKYGKEVDVGTLQRYAVDAVQHAKDHGLRVSFSCEDGTRTPLDVLLLMYRTVDELKVDRLGITDTLGCVTPEGISRLVGEVKSRFDTPVSVHLHNDFGLANANAISAVAAGADAITTTVNGMGERCGNVPLEQFVAAMRFLYGKDLGIDCAKLTPLSRRVAALSRYQCSVNHPITGENAFSHESGIHVAAILNCPATYEYIEPEQVGNVRHLKLGKHSGAHIIEKRLQDMGLEYSRSQLNMMLDEVKRRGERTGRVSDEEFERIVKRCLESKTD